MILTNKKTLLLILFVGSVLRFYNFFEIPFTHDEFSALFRTNFNSFSELITKGVKVDGHPAGVQVFLYYWIQLFGNSEWVVKLPFLIFGILSILLMYLIGKNWYNESVGLISAAFLASIQYTIMYSQIARPYISGMFFSLLMVHYWTKIIRNPEDNFKKNAVLFVLAASLCCYNHHFSLLFAAIVGVSGLFFIKKVNLVRYLLCGSCIFLLYIPHLNIFFYQLSIGGVERWLGKPQNNFIINYLAYTFNFSMFVLGLAMALILWGLYKMNLSFPGAKKFILFASWFLLPFFIGFLYSRYVNGVLQYSVLIFSFPFVFLILFGHVKPQKAAPNFVIVLTILTINSFSTIKERKHYQLFYNSSLEQILNDHQLSRQNHNKVVSVVDSKREISRYYFKKNKIDSTIVWLRSFKGEEEFIAFLNEQSKNYDQLYFGCLASSNPVTIPIIQDYYPTILWQKNYAGGTTYLFSKEKRSCANVVSLLNFEAPPDERWASINIKKYNNSQSFSGKISYHIDNEDLWSPGFEESIKEKLFHDNNFIDVSVRTRSKENLTDVSLIVALEFDGNLIYWGSAPFDKYKGTGRDKEGWDIIHHSIKMSDVHLDYPGIILKTYIWNKGKKSFLIDDFAVEIRDGNPVIYGLNEPISPVSLNDNFYATTIFK